MDVAAFDAWWVKLPEANREALITQARTELIGDNPVLRQYFERHPERLFEALRSILQQLCGWSQGTQEGGGGDLPTGCPS